MERHSEVESQHRNQKFGMEDGWILKATFLVQYCAKDNQPDVYAGVRSSILNCPALNKIDPLSGLEYVNVRTFVGSDVINHREGSTNLRDTGGIEGAG